MNEAVTDTVKARKPRKNLTLDPEAQRLAEELRQADHRPSLVNTLESLIFDEAKRRGFPSSRIKEAKAA